MPFISHPWIFLADRIGPDMLDSQFASHSYAIFKDLEQGLPGYSF